jgi:hypothetical protein
MIKWEKPMLISLNDATEARGLCDLGSGDSGDCIPGNAAGGKCDANGNSPLRVGGCYSNGVGVTGQP